ncbi:uncharacterized protein LOC131614666 [Vicia villosa]|uniref:uncharacterized protein LOC131614666 n=1 Tax=Vicia villosa TaxID=3911 RepID=UPI00273AD778|nr:uncharacterized protein LOC131614666 [Vicia villosa]
MQKKGIKVDALCPMCNMEAENVQHLLMDCVFVRQSLFSSALSYRIPSDLCFNDWLQSILFCGDCFSIQLIGTILYKVWLSRNLKLYQFKNVSPIEIAVDAVTIVAEFNRFNPSSGGVILNSESSDASKKDVYNIQVDASISSDGAVALGCIIMDQYNAISLAACKKEDVSVEVALAEAMAIRWGLLVAKDLNLERIVIKSDAKVVVDCVNLMLKRPVLEPLIIDIRNLLSSFNFASLLFHSRNCNRQAHNMARFAFDFGSRTWAGFCPSLEAPDVFPLAFNAS